MSRSTMSARYVQVILDIPGISTLDYALPTDADDACIGLRCVVPVGRRERVGVVVGLGDAAIALERIKPVRRMLDDLSPLASDWLQLTQFAAEYYQHSWGEVALPSLPRALRTVPGPRFEQSLKRTRERAMPRWTESGQPVEPTREQAAAIDAVTRAPGFAAHLLFGVTGSGKTEV